jgi:hypothetical protein
MAIDLQTACGVVVETARDKKDHAQLRWRSRSK